MAFADQNYELIIQQLLDFFQQAGLQVIRTFDLQSACAGDTGICPHHGTNACDCQLTVLMIYGPGNDTIGLTAHRCDGQIWLSFTDSPGRYSATGLEATVMRSAASCHINFRY